MFYRGNTMKKLMLLSLSLFTQITLHAMKTPLHDAAYEGDVNQIRKLIASRADVDACDTVDNNTPLHYAASFGSRKCIKELLKNGAYKNAANSGGDTPLHFAVFSDKSTNTACVTELLKAEVNKNAISKSGFTPLHLATHFNRIGCVRELLKEGANLFITDVYGGKTAREIAKTDEVRNLLQDYENRWRGIQTFCMAQHPCLGELSPAHILPRELYREIFKHLLQ